MNFVEASLVTAVVLATPLIFAALGELVAERAGVLNLSIEGMMLVGAALGFRIAVDTGSLALSILAGVVGGALLSTAHAFLSITLRANQIVSGLTLVMLGSGLSAFIGHDYAGAPLVLAVREVPVPGLARIPFLGQVFFDHDLFVYSTVPLVLVVAYVLFRTRAGQWIRSSGEAPAAADAAGISVVLVRYAATIFGGALAGLGGCYLSVVYSRAWTDNLTAGRGWIALALVIFASWRPVLLLPGAVFFGFIDSLNFQLQASGAKVSADLLGMMPYVLTLVVLMVVWRRQARRHRGMPRALGVPYEREARA